MLCKLTDRQVEKHTVSIYSAEEGDSMFVFNVDIYLWVYTASKPRRTSYGYVACGGNVKMKAKLYLEKFKMEDQLRDFGKDGKIIWEWTVEKWCTVWSGSVGSAKGSVADFFVNMVMHVWLFKKLGQPWLSEWLSGFQGRPYNQSVSQRYITGIGNHFAWKLLCRWKIRVTSRGVKVSGVWRWHLHLLPEFTFLLLLMWIYNWPFSHLAPTKSDAILYYMVHISTSTSWQSIKRPIHCVNCCHLQQIIWIILTCCIILPTPALPLLIVCFMPLQTEVVCIHAVLFGLVHY